MRKSLLFIGLFTMIIAFAACGGRGGNKQNEAQDTTKCAEICKSKLEFAEKWAKFDSLCQKEQEALIAERAEIYKNHLEKCAADTTKCVEKKECCKEKTEMTAEQKADCDAKKAEIKATWAKFETLTLAEKKAFFDKVDALKCLKAEKCCSDGKKCCTKENKDCSKKCAGKQ